MNINNPKYWNDRYLTGDTPWDIGHDSPQLVHYCFDNVDKEAHILIPGGGRAYELSSLHAKGYNQSFLCDWAPEAINEAKRVNPEIPDERFILSDFFDIDQDFDVILEQTFFCALEPQLRANYVKKAHDLLSGRKGYLVGLFFDRTFEHEGPPFGGSHEEYSALLSPRFDILSFDWADESIDPRKGTERFLVARAK